jgi:fructokinase
MQLVTLGEILIDLFPAEVGRRLAEVTAFHPKPGGAPANVAVATRRLGASAAFIGKVGNDAFGYHLIDVLRREDVETRGMRIDSAARTTLAVIAMPDAQSAEFVFYRNPGADLLLRPDELDGLLLEETRALHIGSLSLVAEPARSATYAAVERARAAGALISFDANYRPTLWESPDAALSQIRAIMPLVHLLKVNEAELSLLGGDAATDEAALSLLDAGPELVVVTHGAEGSAAHWGGGMAAAPAFSVETVDATGCGDAFIAALLTRLTVVAGWRAELAPALLPQALRYANAAGALTAQKQGVIPALPTADQVEAFLAGQPPSSQPARIIKEPFS